MGCQGVFWQNLSRIRQNTSYLSNSQAMRCKRRQTLVTPEPGAYCHYKGGLYEVLGVARHSETEEELVVYRALHGAGGLWVRPKAMFLEPVAVGGSEVPRFRYVGAEAPAQ